MATAVAKFAGSVTQRNAYLTAAEFRQASTGVDTTQLVTGGNQAAQDAELLTKIRQASSWMDRYCFGAVGGLGAQSWRETGIVRPGRAGDIAFRPHVVPVLEVTSVNVANPPSQPQALDLGNCFVFETGWRIQSPASFASSAGPLQFGGFRPGVELFADWTYVAGWAHTLSSGATTATTVPVASATGFYPGTVFTIQDGAATEDAVVLSVAGNTITTTAPLANAHAAGVSVSALPPGIRLAAILLTAAIIKTRGNASLVLSAGGAVHEGSEEAGGDDFAIASELLDPYRAVA